MTKQQSLKLSHQLNPILGKFGNLIKVGIVLCDTSNRDKSGNGSCDLAFVIGLDRFESVTLLTDVPK